MAIIRSYVNGFELSDLTENLMLVPNVWGLSQQLGIFTSDSVTQQTVTLEVLRGSYGLLEDRIRGQRAMLNSDDGRTLHSFAIPHFPGDDYITPRDLVGKTAYGSNGAPERLDLVRARKLERIRQSHAATLETARMHTLITGNAYAPNGTVTYDWYAEFGVTRKTVSFALGTATTDIIAKIEEVIAYIQDNAFTGSVVGDIFALCSPEFFAALVAHPSMKEAYKYYASQPQILRDRLTARGLDARYREFYFGGVLFIEYRGGFAGRMGEPVTRYIPAGEAVFLPRSTGDEFVTYFAPAEKFDIVGTLGQEAYAFEYRDPKGEAITIETETNFLNVLRRPQLIVRATIA